MIDQLKCDCRRVAKGVQVAGICGYQVLRVVGVPEKVRPIVSFGSGGVPIGPPLNPRLRESPANVAVIIWVMSGGLLYRDEQDAFSDRPSERLDAEIAAASTIEG